MFCSSINPLSICYPNLLIVKVAIFLLIIRIISYHMSSDMVMYLLHLVNPADLPSSN